MLSKSESYERCSLAIASNKGPCGRSTTPPPRWSGEENRKKKDKKLVGQDKGSLTEQQTK